MLTLMGKKIFMPFFLSKLFVPTSHVWALTVPRRYFFCGSFVLFVLCLSCFRVCSLLPSGHLKGKG